MLKKIGTNQLISVEGIVAVQPFRDTIYGIDAGTGGVKITYSSGAVVTMRGVTFDEIAQVLLG